MADQHEEEMAASLTSYLAEHPSAMDTIRGIAEWWLMRERIHVDIGRLERVLHRLVESGILETVGPSASPRYRLRRDRPFARATEVERRAESGSAANDDADAEDA